MLQKNLSLEKDCVKNFGLKVRLDFIITFRSHPTHPPIRSKCLYWLYHSHFLTEWAEILHDSYLGGKDDVWRQNIDPAALQYTMQRCRISNRTITQPFLMGLSWNLAWLLLRCKQSSLDTKYRPFNTAVFHAALQNLYSDHNSAISYPINLKFGMIILNV